MSSPAPELTQEPRSAAVLDERHREFLDYLIELAWADFLRAIGRAPANENHDPTDPRAV